MSDNYVKVEGEADLAKDLNVPGVVINRNKNAYERAKLRSTREINTLKSEMHEIKNLLQQLVDK